MNFLGPGYPLNTTQISSKMAHWPKIFFACGALKRGFGLWANSRLQPTKSQQTVLALWHAFQTLIRISSPGEEDIWRDMSGDALTTRIAGERGVHAQCSLAAVRNLRRNQDYTRQRLAERCVAKSYADDVRFPDWAALVLPMLGASEGT